MKKIIFTFVLVLVCLCSCNNNKIDYVTEPVTIEYTQKYDNEFKPVYHYGTYHVFKYRNNTIIEDHYFIDPITNDTSYVYSDSISLPNLKISIIDNKVIVYTQLADMSEPRKFTEFTLYLLSEPLKIDTVPPYKIF